MGEVNEISDNVTTGVQLSEEYKILTIGCGGLQSHPFLGIHKSRSESAILILNVTIGKQQSGQLCSASQVEVGELHFWCHVSGDCCQVKTSGDLRDQEL